MTYANNKGAGQPPHLRSLISTFVVRCLDSIIPLVNPEDRFSRDEAPMCVVLPGHISDILVNFK